MQSPRNAKTFARFGLVWFVMALGAAIASPWVNPQTLQLVCSASGAARMVVASDDGTPAPIAHTLDCPLCMGSGAPPAQRLAVAVPMRGAADTGPVFDCQHVPQRAAAPLPARGPPTCV